MSSFKSRRAAACAPARWSSWWSMLLPALLPVGLAGTVAVLAAPSAALATPAAAFSPAQRAALEARLSAGLQRVVDRQPRIDGQGQAVVVVARFNARGDTLVVDAGHGIYFHHRFDDWRAQRDPSNGITEDFLTPGLATELSTWLSARSGATSTFPRSTEPPSTPPVHKRGGRSARATAWKCCTPNCRPSGTRCPMPRTSCASATRTSAAARCWPSTSAPTP